MTSIGPVRRFALATFAVLCAAVLFRTNVASALVTRGDDRLRAGELDGAIGHYRRAAEFDPRSAVAVDRLAFALLMRRGPGDAALAYERVDAALRTAPHDAALLADRAFAARRLGRWRVAERDFSAAARLARDPRFAHFAARMAQRAGDRKAERAHLEAAVSVDPTYAPARIALGRWAR